MGEQPSNEDVSDRLLSTVTALTGAGTFRWDLDSDRLSLSDRARAILSVTDGAPTTQVVIDRAVHPEDRDRARDLRDRSRSDAALVPAGEWQLVGANDRVRWVAMTMVPAPGRERPTQMLGSLLDVTERHEWLHERELYLSGLGALVRGAEPAEAASALLAGLEEDEGTHVLSAEAEETVRAFAAQIGSRARPADESPLTARETEVLALASHGGSSASIGLRLDVSASTVKTHFEHIYAKLGVADRAGAVAEALRRGLIV